MIVTNYAGDPFAYESITPGDTATGITLSVLKASDRREAKAALIQVEDETVNYTIHGTAPTAAAGTNIGNALEAGEAIMIIGSPAIRNFSCIDRVSGSAGTVKIILFK